MTYSAVEAQEKCAAMDTTLARIPTESLREKIVAVTLRGVIYRYFIGLHSDAPGFPSM